MRFLCETDAVDDDACVKRSLIFMIKLVISLRTARGNCLRHKLATPSGVLNLL